MNIKAKQYKDYKDSWFVFGNSIPFKETTIQLRKNKYCKLANVKQIRVHDFRHPNVKPKTQIFYPLFLNKLSCI